jgi:hypothetical protein
MNQQSFQDLLQEIQISNTVVSSCKEEQEKLLGNPDILLWLNKVGYKTRPNYETALAYFLKCTKINSPTTLLDLKMNEAPKRRFFPAERLIETWIAIAERKGVKKSQINLVVTAVRSFFRHNRVPLVEVSYSYDSPLKEPFDENQLRQFRDCFNFYGKIIFDFLLSVPLRDGQFQICPNCGQDFHPRWRHILTYPKIEPYSPFAIHPEKGHENKHYKSGLMQVCFLTPTAAQQLNLYRDLKERELGRQIRPDEYILTASKNWSNLNGSSNGYAHISPTQTWIVRNFFYEASKRGPLNLSPHKLRTWDNAILATRGIDKQLRDIYLGHSCSYEEGYVMQMIPQWQEAFKKAKAMESIDIVSNFTSPVESESRLWQIREQQDELSRLEKELGDKAANAEDYTFAKLLLKKYKQGKVTIAE